MMTDQLEKRGGARKNAGRKSLYGEKSVLIRVPESQVNLITNWLLFNPPNGTKSDLVKKLDFKPLYAQTTYNIPVALEKVAAGFPSPANDHIERGIDLNQHIIHNQSATFIVRVASKSMLNAGIDVDDELVVDRSLEAKHRDIIVACINNEYTVKRLMIESQFTPAKVWLKAENPEYSNIYPAENDEWTIWGVVVYNLKCMRGR
ncbi:LexA family protein [Alkanindiges illinoisensis]|uniref:LexA family protein n=1 Tax=Alkanindiges illinoisensis TaxID=197183 RepID=UPI000479288C